MTAPVVPVQLDLREFRAVPDGPEGYLALWREIETIVHRLDPRQRDTYHLDDARGRLTIRFVDPAAAPARLDGTTRFAIRGVFEPPRIRYACADCREETYGPFVCLDCRAEGQKDRLCDQHAVIVDLDFSRVTCARHKPSCRCGRSATFRCGGPNCRGAAGWCDQHRIAHPGDPARGYCQDCYARLFPACTTAGCGATGSMSCEYAVAAGRSCGERQCPRHGYRWQVFGPQLTGLALCPRHHQDLRRLTSEQLIRQVVAGTGSRRRHGRGPRLPALRGLRHMLINVRREVVDIPVLARMVESLRRESAGTAAAEVFDAAYERSVAAALATATSDRDAGLAHFARLQQFLRGQGYGLLADRMTYSDFTPRSNLLFVRVPDDLRGQFFGRGRQNVEAMGQFLGLTVRLERS
ncbi:hypothetical protein ACQP2X_34935 [Actinoplanes sp. CA-131856]